MPHFGELLRLCPKSFDQGFSLQVLYKADTLECALFWKKGFEG